MIEIVNRWTSAVIYTSETAQTIAKAVREGLDWWREHHEAVGRKQGYTSAQVAEYRRHIEYAAEWLAEQTQEVRS